ncbi:hypothetical protein FEF09_29930 [Chitinophaga pinensis]|uniref:Carboxypeptidase-like regulatory domain-containing protein n=1 Tax=Chitinophaga pinensis TaxID=79329 RepID=A0A5C6LHV0_9BACT|nr:hypothetical protein FEF09_29930 [Chitinophaga pinensis]
MRRLAFFFLLFLTSGVYAQQQHGSISGIVTTKSGEPVAYVNVSVKGTSYGATTTDKVISVSIVSTPALIPHRKCCKIIRRRNR